ncbi:hypothetical protein Y032_0231g3012 [Ancylostoma ceylanicum]|uniref:Uncharacterized protein n=1 Tax=Ancylostoma ceylanicum TaxID=53326 RepID=A0A016SGN4_9BILA|nr:hypothetical protein Y032_0231g3012 [Ancylostoma ceylanicum]
MEESKTGTDSPKFSLSWIVDLTHDDTSGLYRGDYALYDFFFKNRNALSNSFIFFYGDHGGRFGSEAYTSFGYNEQNNPFLYVVVPKHLRNTKISEQLQQNSKEIVTPHDLHATFKDILYFQPTLNFTEVGFKAFDEKSRGSSLLRRFQAGKRRNCRTLPIPFEYCICQYEKKDVTDEALKQSLGQFAVKQLASFLETQNVTSRCEEITLQKVEAKQYLSTKINNLGNNTDFFEVIFEVAAPAKGKFQIPIRKEHGHLNLEGALFKRMDRYGKNGDCMKNDLLRPYCTCKNDTVSH